MPRWPWIERSFTFDFPVEKHPDLVERFRGLPARVEDRVRDLSREQLVWSDGGWSVQETVGHMTTLEALFEGRLDDFLEGRPTLRPADLERKATRAAAFNERDISTLLRSLREDRMRHVRRLQALSDADFARTAAHPRLGQAIRLVDSVAFNCEHDDYYMACIAELLRRQGVR